MYALESMMPAVAAKAEESPMPKVRLYQASSRY
jgi:hypothetical protein